MSHPFKFFFEKGDYRIELLVLAFQGGPSIQYFFEDVQIRKQEVIDILSLFASNGLEEKNSLHGSINSAKNKLLFLPCFINSH